MMHVIRHKSQLVQRTVLIRSEYSLTKHLVLNTINVGIIQQSNRLESCESITKGIDPSFQIETFNRFILSIYELQ